MIYCLQKCIILLLFLVKEGKENKQYSILSNPNTSRIGTHASLKNRIGPKAYRPSPSKRYIRGLAIIMLIHLKWCGHKQ